MTPLKRSNDSTALYPNGKKRLLLAQGKHLSVFSHHEVILDDLNFSFYDDEIILLIGPNGGGKSTLIQLLLRKRLPSAGELWIRNALRIGYVAQQRPQHLSIPLTAQGFLDIHRKKISADHLELILTLSQFPKHRLSSPFSCLSGGEKQRLSLARALQNDPHWLILDEPTAHLDPSSQILFYENLVKIKNIFQSAILLVSHDPHRVLAQADRVICLKKTFLCSGKTQKLCANCSKECTYAAPLLGCYAHHGHPL